MLIIIDGDKAFAVRLAAPYKPVIVVVHLDPERVVYDVLVSDGFFHAFKDDDIFEALTVLPAGFGCGYRRFGGHGSADWGGGQNRLGSLRRIGFSAEDGKCRSQQKHQHEQRNNCYKKSFYLHLQTPYQITICSIL